MDDQLAALFKILGARSMDEAIKKAECYDAWNKLDVKKIKELREEVAQLKYRLLSDKPNPKFPEEIEQKYRGRFKFKLAKTGHIFDTDQQLYNFVAKNVIFNYSPDSNDFDVFYVNEKKEESLLFSVRHTQELIEADEGLVYTYKIEML